MKHILFDLKQCLLTSPLDDEEYVKETLIEAAKIGKLEVLKVDTYKFEPHGVTGYALLAESHISIHTWPEKGTAAIDIYTCGECRPELGCHKIIDMLEAGHHKIGQIER